MCKNDKKLTTFIENIVKDDGDVITPGKAQEMTELSNAMEADKKNIAKKFALMSKMDKQTRNDDDA